VTRDELEAWAAKVGQYDHYVYCGKNITVRDVKLAVQDATRKPFRCRIEMPREPAS